jgi:regulator of cell morphogenesis and NO signaling
MPSHWEGGTPEIDWRRASLSELTTHIVAKDHGRLRVELRTLQDFLREVYIPDRQRDLARLARLPGLLFLLDDELDRHLRREELTVFPAIGAFEKSTHSGESSALAGKSVAALVSVTISEHADILDYLAQARLITDTYGPPPDRQYRTLFQRLGALEHDLELHIAIENERVFPRALSLAAGSQTQHLCD